MEVRPEVWAGHHLPREKRVEPVDSMERGRGLRVGRGGASLKAPAEEGEEQAGRTEACSRGAENHGHTGSGESCSPKDVIPRGQVLGNRQVGCNEMTCLSESSPRRAIGERPD